MVSPVSQANAADPDRRWFARAVPASTRATRWLGGLPIRTRVLAAAAVYFVVTIGILTGILLQVRADTLTAAEKLTASLSRLAADQTALALQSVDQTLTIADTLLSRRHRAGSLDQTVVGADLRALLRERPFLLVMWVFDPQGRIVYHSKDESVGVDLSDRPYFKHHLGHAGTHTHVAEPIQSRITGAWMLPVTRSWFDADGKLLGVIVAAVDPNYFDRVWRSEDQGNDSSIALLRLDGTLLMRSPLVEQAMGVRFELIPMALKKAMGARRGIFRSTSPIDGIDRLIGFHLLNVDPSLVVVVGQSVQQILAPWRHIAGVVALGWFVATLGLAVLATWLVGERIARLETEAHYRRLFDANPDPMAVFDRETLRYLAVNEAMVRQYGWSREEFLTLTPADIRLPEDMAMLSAVLDKSAPAGGSRTLGGRHRRKDGSVFDVEVSMAEIEFEGRPAMLPMARDISERKQAAQAQRDAEEKLRQLEKMEAVGQLTGGVAHDFNNILMVMMANTDALEEEYELEPEVREHVDNIAKQTRRAADLTRQLLVFSRKQPLKPQVTDLNELVVATGRLLRRTLGEKIEIESTLEDNLFMVNVDRTQLETALVNLCVNGRDAMPGGGRLLIETRNVSFDQAYAARNADAVAGAHAMLAVTDTGVGIAPENIDKVFEPFFTTKDVGRGTGLGLSMVYGFIKQSKGHIRIESEPGRGTTVKLYLPRTDEAAEVADAPVASLPTGHERILVVEDDAKVRDNVVRQLRSLGYAVEQAGDGTSGLAACEAAHGMGGVPFDLMLTDVIMPGPVGGKELADEIGRRWPATAIVFMSGYTEDAITLDGRLEPGVRLLNKPFRKGELARMIRDALDGAYRA
ncbi:MAG: ATP-binding protein [Reyranella sp.]|nr:ATP-binding protein [Reyranella sp.]